MRDLLKERERAFEAVYCSQQDAKLIGKIRERARLHDIAEALAAKLRVDNADLLEHVVALGLTRETGAAILLAPLVQVAWAEGVVSGHERDTILEIASSRGIEAGTPAHAQLIAWLEVRPSDALFDAALDVLNVAGRVLPADERESRIRSVLETCRQIAEASGGVGKALGIDRGVSRREAAVLDAIEAGLRANAPPRS